VTDSKITREHLPPLRRGWTQKAYVGGQKLYLTVSEYPDGRPGEIFLIAAKTGTLIQSMLSGWAIAVSGQLQYGVPLESIVASYVNTKFDPCGVVTGDEKIKFASSIFDYIVKRLSLTYLTAETSKTGVETSAVSTPASTPVAHPLERIAQETADKFGEPVLVIEQPLGDPYAALESVTTDKEKTWAVRRVLPANVVQASNVVAIPEKIAGKRRLSSQL